MNKLNFDVMENLSNKQIEALSKLLTPRMTKYVPHIPTPKQSAFLCLTCKEAFYGGSAGGGKSDALLMGALQYVDIPGYSAILFRKTFSDLMKPGALIDRAKEWLAPFIGKEVKWQEKERKFTFYQQYGPHWDKVSILSFGYLDTEMDRFNYQGGEYQFVGFDEVCQISEPNYRYLFSRARRLNNSIVPLRIRSASNPPDKFCPLIQ